MLKTYGLIFADGTKQLASVVLDEEGNPRIDTIKPYPVPENWVDPTLVELVKIECPGDEADYEPFLVWFEDRVERQWKQITN
jgi:hypothetical protein